MGFEPITIFPGELLEGAERLARDTSANNASLPASIIRDMGWSSTLIAEKHGGYGGSFNDIGAVLEGLASRATNLPVMTRCCIVPGMLMAATETEAIRTCLSRIAEGAICVELAGPLNRYDDAAVPRLSPTGGGWRLTGTLDAVEWTADCTHLLFCARNTVDNTPCVVILEATQLPEPSTAFSTVELRQVKQIDLPDLKLDSSAVLAKGDSAQAMSRAGWALAQAAIAADMVCTMNNMLAETIRYLQDRKQFGQPLAQFQVLRHDVARLYVDFETCKNLLMSSLRSLDAGGFDDQCLAAFDLLGLYMREQAVEFAQSVIQLHGGMGMTRETLAARMASRLIGLAFRYGDAYAHTRALSEFQNGSQQ